MKSIKEKSKEYDVVIQRISPNESLVNVSGREQFEAGANYVLDEIENVIKSDRILGHPFPSLEMQYNQIISVIEQLKK